VNHIGFTFGKTLSKKVELAMRYASSEITSHQSLRALPKQTASSGSIDTLDDNRLVLLNFD
jgi:hypothetical protein